MRLVGGSRSRNLQGEERKCPFEMVNDLRKLETIYVALLLKVGMRVLENSKNMKVCYSDLFNQRLYRD